MKMVPLIFVLIIINLPACLAVKLNTLAPASSTMLNQVNATATTEVNQTQTKDIYSLIQESGNNETKELESALPSVELANSQEPLVVSEQEITINKMKTALSEQPNQDKLYFETLKEDADEELDDFPVVLDTNIKPADDDSNSPEAIIQRGRNQDQLENIIFDGEIKDLKEEEAQQEPITEAQRQAENQAKEEEPLSFSEIIQRRFKDKIEVNSASTPQEVEDLIIKPGYTANSFIDNNSWLVSFLDERRYPKMNGTLSKLYWKLHKKMPTMEELRDTSNQIADNLKQRLINSGNLILAQVKSEQPEQRGGLQNPNKLDQDSRRNVILLVCVVVQTIICCTLTKVLFVPLSQEAAYELSHRTNKRQDGKIYVLRDPVTLKYYQNIIQDAQQQKKLDKVQSKRLKRANTKRLWADSEAGASQSGGGGSQVDVGSRASKADIEQSGGGHGSRVSSYQKSKKKKKKQPHLRPSAK